MIPSTVVASSSSSSSSSLPPPPTHLTFLNRKPKTRVNPPLSSAFTRARGFRCASWHRGGGPSRNSNAEPVRRPGQFRFQDDGDNEEDGSLGGRSKRRRWYDEASDELDEEPYDILDDDLDQPWDRIWIFKVFRSYGYLLPAIIVSMLLATGPKAFLMALALPLGQSAISLAIDKIWGHARERPRTRPKTKKKPFARSGSYSQRQWQEESTGENKGRQSYQSWVPGDAGVAEKRNASSRSTFGGWDELDGQERSSMGSMRRQPSYRSAQSEQPSRTKLSKRGRYKEVPLFLRLLIAVFPFLGSWTRIL